MCLHGASNKKAQRDAASLLNTFELVPTTTSDVNWAVKELTRTTLTHGTDILDALIASTAYHLQTPLYTRNLKHFKPLLDDAAQVPY